MSLTLPNKLHCQQVTLVLHPTKMCFSVAGVGHIRHLRSLAYHWLRFAGEGSTSYAALMVKLALNASISHSSFQVIHRFSTPSHASHCPLLCLCHSMSTASCFLFQMHLLDPHLVSLRSNGLVPRGCTGTKTEITLALLALGPQCSCARVLPLLVQLQPMKTLIWNLDCNWIVYFHCSVQFSNQISVQGIMVKK